MTASMIAHLPCGVLFVKPNGLVRQANAAARQMLGFASPLGMSLTELFGDAKVVSDSNADSTVGEAFQGALQSKSGTTNFESLYLTPNGEERLLKFTLIPMCAPTGERLGMASVVSDESASADLRRGRGGLWGGAGGKAPGPRSVLGTLPELGGESSRATRPGR